VAGIDIGKRWLDVAVRGLEDALRSTTGLTASAS